MNPAPGAYVDGCTHRRRHRHASSLAYMVCDCRCADCLAAYRQYSRSKRRGERALVDAAPARDRIAHLQAAGVPLKRIAWDAGLGVRTIDAIVSGENQRIRRVNLEALQRVPETRDSGKIIDATGARRRLQALSLHGWTAHELAAAAGVATNTVQRIMSGRQMRARTNVIVAVEAAYERLWDQPAPTPRNPQQQAARKTAINRARRLGWAPAMAWDDDTIDNPDAHPAGTDADPHSTPASVEARWRLDLGEPLETVARDLGCSVENLRQTVTRPTRRKEK